MKFTIVALLCSLSFASAGGLITKGNLHPRRMHDVIYYDDSFCFVVRTHGDNRDSYETIEPGLFVHSKTHGIWVQIEKVSTAKGSFGKNDMKDPRLKTASVAWDFTPLEQAEFAEIPLRTSGSICFPDEVTYDADKEIFRLGFLTIWQVPDAATYLYIERKDLLEAFSKYKNPHN